MEYISWDINFQSLWKLNHLKIAFLRLKDKKTTNISECAKTVNVSNITDGWIAKREIVFVTLLRWLN